jgi:hypothetical protein
MQQMEYYLLLLLAQQQGASPPHEEMRPVHVFALSATSLATMHVPVKQGTKNDKPKPDNNCAPYWPERSYWQEEDQKGGGEDKLTTLATTKSSSCSTTWPMLVVNVSGIAAIVA